MKIVAFLQNPWFQPGTREEHIIRYRDDQRFHRRVLEMSMTGRRLRAAFGQLYDEIHWDNTSWIPANTAPGKIPTDLSHMCKVLEEQEPDLVLTFGNQARDACDIIMSINKCLIKARMHCHHPNARHKFQADLDRFARQVRDAVLAVKIPMWGDQ